MTGWAGYVTIEAMRFCSDHSVAIIVLDWTRDFLTVVAPPAQQSAALIRAQVAADPLPIAKALIRAKIEAHAALGAILRQARDEGLVRLAAVASVQHALMVEAFAAQSAWSLSSPSLRPSPFDKSSGSSGGSGQAFVNSSRFDNPSWFDKLTMARDARARDRETQEHDIVLRWREAGAIPRSWKLPYGARRRMNSRNQKSGSARRATDPINALLNLAFAVTIGRLAVALQACGLSPAIGFMHRTPRWALAYDAIEPLRPHVEAAVFRFIEAHRFSPGDFIHSNDGQVKTRGALTRCFLDAVAAPQSAIDNAVQRIIGYLSSAGTLRPLTGAQEVQDGT